MHPCRACGTPSRSAAWGPRWRPPAAPGRGGKGRRKGGRRVRRGGAGGETAARARAAPRRGASPWRVARVIRWQQPARTILPASCVVCRKKMARSAYARRRRRHTLHPTVRPPAARAAATHSPRTSSGHTMAAHLARAARSCLSAGSAASAAAVRPSPVGTRTRARAARACRPHAPPAPAPAAPPARSAGSATRAPPFQQPARCGECGGEEGRGEARGSRVGLEEEERQSWQRRHAAAAARGAPGRWRARCGGEEGRREAGGGAEGGVAGEVRRKVAARKVVWRRRGGERQLGGSAWRRRGYGLAAAWRRRGGGVAAGWRRRGVGWRRLPPRTPLAAHAHAWSVRCVARSASALFRPLPLMAQSAAVPRPRAAPERRRASPAHVPSAVSPSASLRPSSSLSVRASPVRVLTQHQYPPPSPTPRPPTPARSTAATTWPTARTRRSTSRRRTTRS
jgi:hypothetical protein